MTVYKLWRIVTNLQNVARPPRTARQDNAGGDMAGKTARRLVQSAKRPHANRRDVRHNLYLPSVNICSPTVSIYSPTLNI